MTIPERQDFIDDLTRRYLTDPEPEVARSNGAGEKETAVSFSDDEVIKRCCRAKNAAKFSDLFDAGDVDRHHDGDHSSADLALISLLAFYTQDPEQLDRLFRQSALMRPKWDERRGGGTYGRRTIDRALLNLSETYTPPASSSSRSYRENDDDDANSSDSLAATTNAEATATERSKPGNPPLAVKRFRELPKPEGPRQFTVEDLVPERFVTTLYGDGGSAKSIIALSIAIALARGDESWLGFRLRPCPALVVDFELDEEEQGRRARQIGRGFSEEGLPDNLYYLCASGRRIGEVFDRALMACKEHEIGFVVLDSIGPAMEGDPGDARDVVGFFRKLERFRHAKVTVLVIDHQAKVGVGESYQAKTAYGSVYKGNLSRSRVQVEARERGAGTLGVVLRHNKANFSGISSPFKARLAFSEEKITIEREELEIEDLAQERTLNSSDRILMRLQDGPAFPEDLVEPTGVSIGTVRNNISTLRRRALIEDTEERQGRSHQVRLTDAGRRHIKDYLGGGPRTSSSSFSLGDRDDDDADLRPPTTPLSADLRPGESATLEELRARREGQEDRLSSQDVRELFSKPPQWLRNQAENCRRQGASSPQLEALAASVAAHLCGDPTRGSEVLSAVEAQFHPLGCECEECA